MYAAMEKLMIAPQFRLLSTKLKKMLAKGLCSFPPAATD
jgi:hypothetical protein